MTLEETGEVMDVLKAVYPQFYAKQTEDEKYAAASLWSSLFEPYPAALVVAALKAFIATDEKGFPPVPGQIMAKVRMLTQPEQMGEAEAWALVRRAATGDGLYRAREAFDKLPPPVQKIVGSPNQLREWAMMEEDVFNSVVASNFQRAYRTQMTRERELNALPPDVRRLAEALGRGHDLGALDSPPSSSPPEKEGGQEGEPPPAEGGDKAHP